MKELRKIAKSLENYIIRIRREIHQYPELRWEEERTLKLIAQEIKKTKPAQGIVVNIKKEFTGGLVVDVTINAKYNWILFRSDVDAVPVEKEETGLPFASKNPGAMHACGHDIHAAMLLGSFKTIVKGKITPKHNIRFVFQRAEENPLTEPGGARLVKEGVCKGVSYVYALHIYSIAKPGVYYSRPGPFLGNSDRLKLTVKCSGGHVALPHQGVNALRIIQSIQNSLDGLPNRILGPLQPATLEPTILNSGTSSNTMPSEAELWYGVRTLLEPKKRDNYMNAIEILIKKTVSAFPEAKVKIERILGHPTLINTPENYQMIKSVLETNSEKVQEHEPVLGGEDFAHYLYQCPGSAWFLGAYQKGAGDHHSPTFNPNENVFWKGTLFWLLLATN